MDIRISKNSEVPVRDQLIGQIIYMIATRELKPGDTLPSVRMLARMLNIHHNTVSEAYRDLVGKDLLSRRRGSRLVVRIAEEPLDAQGKKCLDDLINDAIRTAQKSGYTLRQLEDRVRERLLEAPPDHVLAISIDPAMCRLFEAELVQTLRCSVASCSPEQLLADPKLAIGALAITPPGVLPRVARALPKIRPAVTIMYSDAKEHLDMVRQLAQPSIVGVASVSESFLDIAQGLLGPAVSPRHSLLKYLLPPEGPHAAPPADILFCDTIAHELLRGKAKPKRLVPYRLISERCIEQIAEALGNNLRTSRRVP